LSHLNSSAIAQRSLSSWAMSVAGRSKVTGIALVEDVSGAGFQRDGAAGHDPRLREGRLVDRGRGQLEPHRPALPRIVEQVQFQPARAGIGLGPREAIARERDRRGVEQPDQGLAIAAQHAGGHRDQRQREVAEHRSRPVGIGVGQGRAARRAQIEVVKPAAVRAQPGDDLAQAGQSRQLREQQALQMPLAGPRVVTAAPPRDHHHVPPRRGRLPDDPAVPTDGETRSGYRARQTSKSCLATRF